MQLATVENSGYTHEDRLVKEDGTVLQFACEDDGYKYFVEPKDDGSLVSTPDPEGTVPIDGRSIVAVETYHDGLGDEEVIFDEGDVSRQLYAQTCEDALKGTFVRTGDVLSFKFWNEIATYRIGCSTVWAEYEENILLDRELNSNELLVLGVLKGEGFRYLHKEDGIIFKPEAIHTDPDGQSRDFTDICPEFFMHCDGGIDTPETWIARAEEVAEDSRERMYQRFTEALPEFSDGSLCNYVNGLSSKVEALPDALYKAFFPNQEDGTVDSGPFAWDSGFAGDSNWYEESELNRIIESNHSDPYQELCENSYQDSYPGGFLHGWHVFLHGWPEHLDGPEPETPNEFER